MRWRLFLFLVLSCIVQKTGLLWGRAFQTEGLRVGSRGLASSSLLGRPRLITFTKLTESSFIQTRRSFIIFPHVVSPLKTFSFVYAQSSCPLSRGPCDSAAARPQHATTKACLEGHYVLEKIESTKHVEYPQSHAAGASSDQIESPREFGLLVLPFDFGKIYSWPWLQASAPPLDETYEGR